MAAKLLHHGDRRLPAAVNRPPFDEIQGPAAQRQLAPPGQGEGVAGRAIAKGEQLEILAVSEAAIGMLQPVRLG